MPLTAPPTVTFNIGQEPLAPPGAPAHAFPAPDRPVAEIADRRDLCVDFFQPGSHRLHQAFACFRGRNAARRTRQQPHAKARFQVADGVTQRRLGDAELCSRAREAAFVRHRQERKDVGDVLA